MLQKIQLELQKLANPEKAKILQGFFKTGKGQYGEGDIFLGITVSEQRKIAKKFIDLDLQDIAKLLSNKIHEYRLTALLILVEQFKKSDEKSKKKIFDFYLNNTNGINNWDLVDLSADKIVGEYLYFNSIKKVPLEKGDKGGLKNFYSANNSKSIIFTLAHSKNLWERRIVILSTFAFIKKGEFKEALEISEILLYDKHDLIQKAVGWMLREVGKRDLEVEESFLKKYYKTMPRTCLRYAIERFEERKRKYYLG